MIKKMGYHWHLRQSVATRLMFQTTDLVGPLAERGITLSREQVFRLVTRPPQRLSMYTLAALCDILDCQPGDLIDVRVVNEEIRKTADEALVRPLPTARPRSAVPKDYAQGPRAPASRTATGHSGPRDHRRHCLTALP
ncbi:helix-turn-helix domain-containing protein [Streptomyces chartreusis]